MMDGLIWRSVSYPIPSSSIFPGMKLSTLFGVSAATLTVRMMALTSHRLFWQDLKEPRGLRCASD